MKKSSTYFLLTFVMIFLLVQTGCKKKVEPKTLSDEEAIEILQDAYVFGYPLVTMKLSEKNTTNVEVPIGMNAPINQLGNNTKFPDDTFTDIVSPNVDTFYSQMWLELKNEPMVLSLPATDRYHLMQLMDAWTNVFSSIGTRTTGNSGGAFLITGPSWNGTVPKGMTQVKAPTNMVWIMGRTQVNSKEDGEKVVTPLIEQYKLVPLSKYGKEYTPPKGEVDTSLKMQSPVKSLEEMSAKDFFNMLNMLMVDNSPAAADAPAMAEFKKVGVEPGKKFETTKFSDAVISELNNLVSWCRDKILAKPKSSSDKLVNGWGINTHVGSYGTDYVFRAYVTYNGLGANLPEDAMYPRTVVDPSGNFYDGNAKYVFHMTKEQIPEANAFWSVTIYNSKNFLIKNPLNRYALGDRDKLIYGDDGSLTLYIQPTTPGKDKEANWLPSPPNDTFNLAIRMYLPTENVLNGKWRPAGVMKVE